MQSDNKTCTGNYIDKNSQLIITFKWLNAEIVTIIVPGFYLIFIKRKTFWVLQIILAYLCLNIYNVSDRVFFSFDVSITSFSVCDNNVIYFQILMNATQTTVAVAKNAITTLEVTGVPVIKTTIWKATVEHVQVTISTKAVD